MSQNIDHSETYRAKLAAAIQEARNLGFPNATKIDPAKRISDSTLLKLQKLLNDDFYAELYRKVPFYWGDKCQTLTSHLFAKLSSVGLEVDIVLGEVNINGTLEFDATLASLRMEYQGSLKGDNQSLHAWITIGDDTVIDAGLPDRMIRHYRFPERYMPPIMVGRANELAEKFKAKHEPLLVGTDFIAKTNSIDPRSLLHHYKSANRSY
ncbi:conserved hypothetical protein [Rubrivivax sp. A210]|uniref:hypothetical protein n=1 Tax=Rubrivivax sp. A210 TaxID=2772301 RepID=UPI00191A8E0C|nr:hypothetical protein [Rubrivivax sp. A210]CAD5373589.1 conserved hypothetical protein [Rubrivivax sp. A210]